MAKWFEYNFMLLSQVEYIEKIVNELGINLK